MNKQFETISDADLANVSGAGLVTGRVLRVDRDEFRQFTLHAGDVG